MKIGAFILAQSEVPRPAKTADSDPQFLPPNERQPGLPAAEQQAHHRDRGEHHQRVAIIVRHQRMLATAAKQVTNRAMTPATARAPTVNTIAPTILTILRRGTGLLVGCEAETSAPHSQHLVLLGSIPAPHSGQTMSFTMISSLAARGRRDKGRYRHKTGSHDH